MRYRTKFLTRDHFDNYYITSNMRLLDEKREDALKDVLLPLKGKEKRKYIETSKRTTCTRTALYM